MLKRELDYYEKILLYFKALLFVLFLQLSANLELYAQKDAFFTYHENNNYRNADEVLAPGLPRYHGMQDNFQSPAPLGNGLIALSLLGAGYLVKKSRKNRNKKNNIKIIILGMMILGHGFSAEAQNFYFPKPADNFYGDNMSVYGQLIIDGEFADENIEIGAFCGDEVRGRAFIIKQGSTYLFFLTREHIDLLQIVFTRFMDRQSYSPLFIRHFLVPLRLRPEWSARSRAPPPCVPRSQKGCGNGSCPLRGDRPPAFLLPNRPLWNIHRKNRSAYQSRSPQSNHRCSCLR